MNEPARLLESGCDSFALDALLAAREERAPVGVEARSAAVVEAVLGLSRGRERNGSEGHPLDSSESHPRPTDCACRPRHPLDVDAQRPVAAPASGDALGEPKDAAGNAVGGQWLLGLRLGWRRFWSSLVFAGLPVLRGTGRGAVERRA